MKSIKTKIIVLVLSFVLFSSLAIGGICIVTTMRAEKEASNIIMNLLCSSKTNSIDTLLRNAEEATKSLVAYTYEQMEDTQRLKEERAYLDAYTSDIMAVALNAAKNTTGVASVYLRIDPVFNGKGAGFWYGKDSVTEKFESFPVTIITDYDEDDMEHVGWFYEPKRQGKEVWMGPYYNENSKREIISYVTPLYIEGEFFGVLGIDIDFSVLKSVVAETSVYDTGYAYLASASGQIIYHKDLARGTDIKTYNQGEFVEMAETLKYPNPADKSLLNYEYNGEQKEATFRTLSNQMRLVLTAPSSEINAQAQRLLINAVLTMLVVIGIATLLTFLFTKRLVRPLLELNHAAKQIADGDLGVHVTHRSKDEVGTLAESFRQTVNHLQTYFSYIQQLAYEDTLTGAKNTASYEEMSHQYQQRILAKESFHFAIVVFDINFLKDVNDHYGHIVGDEIIKHAFNIMSTTFPNTPIYRIGGDEFVALVEHDDYDHLDDLLNEFERKTEENEDCLIKGVHVSIAYGMARYQSGDMDYREIFQRADHSMYQNKARMKLDGQSVIEEG